MVQLRIVLYKNNIFKDNIISVGSIPSSVIYGKLGGPNGKGNQRTRDNTI